jgi:23S rRNA pseudouridine1911/1915/1917 synthase
MSRGPGRLLVTVAPEQAGLRLDAVVGAALLARLGHEVAKSALRRMLMSGAVRRAGRPLRRPGLPVEAGWRLSVAADPDRLLPARDAAFVMGEAAVLFEDAWLLAVAKPAGLPTVPTADPARASLVSAVAEWLGRRGERPYLAVHQRLDRDTSGVVLFGRDEAANAGLARAFAGREVEKLYEALTARPRRPPPDAFTIDAPVDGKPAVTDVRVLGRLAGGGLHVEARPQTGRKHQVRVHLAAAGLPILGDVDHGGPGVAARTLLHARRLDLRHPVTGAVLRLECPLPADFQAALRRFSARARTPRR